MEALHRNTVDEHDAIAWHCQGGRLVEICNSNQKPTIASIPLSFSNSLMKIALATGSTCTSLVCDWGSKTLDKLPSEKDTCQICAGCLLLR